MQLLQTYYFLKQSAALILPTEKSDTDKVLADLARYSALNAALWGGINTLTDNRKGSTLDGVSLGVAGGALGALGRHQKFLV